MTPSSSAPASFASLPYDDWPCDWAYRLRDVLKKSLFTPGETAALLSASSEEALIRQLPVLLNFFDGVLPAEVLQRPGLVHGLSPLMLQEFMSSDHFKSICRHWVVGWSLGTSAVLWDRYGTLFFMPAVVFGGGAVADGEMRFASLCMRFNMAVWHGPEYARVSTARLFAHCLATLCTPMDPKLLACIRENITDKSEVARPAADMIQGFLDVFPTLLDEAMPGTGNGHDTLGYRIMAVYNTRKHMDPMQALRRAGFVKRYAMQHLDFLKQRRLFAEFILISEYENEADEEAWFTDLESDDPAAVSLAHFVMELFTRRKFSGSHGTFWIQRFLRTVPRVEIIRRSHSAMLSDATAELLTCRAGYTLEAFLRTHSDVMASDAHEAAMAAFLVEEGLENDWDLLGVLDTLQEHDYNVYGELKSHGLLHAAAYTAFSRSLCGVWVAACVQNGIAAAFPMADAEADACSKYARIFD